MEAVINESVALGQRCLKLADLISMFRRSSLEQELAKAKARIDWQKKHTERTQQRYDTLDRRCAALSSEIDGLRSRLYAAEQQTEAFKEVAKAAVGTAEDLKRIYQAAALHLDNGGFNLFPRHRK